MARQFWNGGVYGTFPALSWPAPDQPFSEYIILRMELRGRIRRSAARFGDNEWTMILPEDSPAACEVRIDGSALVALARRACANKRGQAKVGPVVIRARTKRVEREEGWK